jgi:hypothetical protein
MNQKTGLLDEMMAFLLQPHRLTYKDVYTALDILILCPEWEREQAWDILKAVTRRYEIAPADDWQEETGDFLEDMKIILDRPERPDDIELYDAIISLMLCQESEREEAWNIMRAIVYRYENEPIVSTQDVVDVEELFQEIFRLISLAEQLNQEEVEYYDGYSVLVS